MKVIVITGSTRGIGYGLADAFLARGCAVVVSGRAQAGVDQAVAELSGKHGADRILGQACDVTAFEQVQAVWDVAVARFGRVDVWINNAGAGHRDLEFWLHSPETMKTVVDANLTGTMYGAKVAISGMLEQGGGFVYNMEGFGSRGRMRGGARLSIYGSTKAAVRFLTETLQAEVDSTPVKVGSLSPGMVMTELVTDQYKGRSEEWERVKPIFNIIADRVETVASFFADRILENQDNGRQIRWLTRPKLLMRFLTARFSKRDVFAEQT